MKNKRIINYAFVRYYCSIKLDDNNIDFRKTEDRLKVVLTIFKHSKLFSTNIEQFLFKSCVEDFYNSQVGNSLSFSNELKELFNFIIMKITGMIEESQPRNGNLISFNDVLLDIFENISKVCDCELNENFELAFEILKKTFGQEFPEFNEELIKQSFKDKKSYYFY